MSDSAAAWLGDGAKGFATGAAYGSAVMPGIGTIAGGLIGLATSLVPHVFGDESKPALAAAAAAVTQLTDEGAQVAVLASDPVKQAEFAVQLRQIALDERKAELAGVQGAREANLALVAAKSPLQWGTAIVSAYMLLLWTGSMVAQMGGYAINSDDTSLVRNAALVVIGYWVGSSAGSAAKDRFRSNGGTST